MAAQKPATTSSKSAVESRAKRRSKSRTQVAESFTDESSEVSDTSSPSEDSSSAEEDASQADEDSVDSPLQSTKGDNETLSTAIKATPSMKGDKKTNEDFSAFYLRSVASELADDLEKIRSANDFNASKMPMLVRALKQGEAVFSDEEKRIVMQGPKR